MKVLTFALFAAAGIPRTDAADLLQNGSFELPAVDAPRVASAGGDPAGAQPAGWAPLEMKIDGEGGKLVAGISNQVARTGKQSFFLDFQQLTAPSQWVTLTTLPVAVKPGQSYRVSMWGRIDGKRPLALDERRPYVWLAVQFLKSDGTTEAAETQLGAQMIPGVIVPGDINDLEFVSWKWKESFAIVEIPPETAFIQAGWTWGVPSDAGETDGAIYWDDASITVYVPPPVPPKALPQAAPVAQPGGAPPGATQGGAPPQPPGKE